MKKNVMKVAWKIAKEAVMKFGGKAKEFFREALRIAWASVKEGGNKVIEVTINSNVAYVGSPKQISWVKEVMSKVDVALINDCLKSLYENPEKWVESRFPAIYDYAKDVVERTAIEVQALLDNPNCRYLIDEICNFRNMQTELVCKMAWNKVYNAIDERDFVPGVHYRDGSKIGARNAKSKFDIAFDSAVRFSKMNI